MTNTAASPVLLSGEALSSNEFIRRRNLSAVLTLLHHGGPASRAEVSRGTGLTRSTITGIVAELADLGLVREGEAPSATGRAGRPSSNIEANSEVAALSVHPDTDAVTVALVGLGGEVLARLRHNTSSILDAKRMVRTVDTLVETMRADIDRHYRLVGVGLGVPGLVRETDGRVLLAPHLKWKNEDVAHDLARALGLPVIAGNDASLGALAEYRFGAGEGARDLLFVNGTTSGIGGGVVIGGSLLSGTEGYAGEMGHTLVRTNGKRCYCGRSGCLEAEVSLTNLMPFLRSGTIDEDELDIELGVARDPRLLAEVARQVELLSEALTNFVNLFNPEVVILGGYLGALLSVSRERLTEAVRVRPLGGEARSIRLERARLRSRLMLIGPAELAFGRLLQDPASFEFPAAG